MIQRLVELLAPTECLRCGRSGEILCPECVAVVGAPKAAVCFRCNRLSTQGRTCRQCRVHTALAAVAVASYYDGIVKELVLALKFHRQRSASGAAADMVFGALPDRLAVDLVTSVPVAARRYRERGYNQSELMARRVAAALRRPYVRSMGRIDSVHQLGSGRTTRLEQIAGAFYPLMQLNGQRMLVVDDVITTGATLSECAAVLRGSGAATVWGAALARH